MHFGLKVSDDYGNFATVEQVWLTSSGPGSKDVN